MHFMLRKIRISSTSVNMSEREHTQDVKNVNEVFIFASYEYH